MFIGGNFTGTDKSNAKYNNIVQFDSSANTLKALAGGGLNSVVYSLDATSSGKSKTPQSILLIITNTWNLQSFSWEETLLELQVLPHL